MDKFRCEFLKKCWVRRAWGFKYLNFFPSLKEFVFRCGVLMNLKSKGVLSIGIGRGKDLFFKGVISWVGFSGCEKKRGISFFFFFLSHNTVI